MKTIHKYLVATTILALSAATLRAQSVTVLEGFETFTNTTALGDMTSSTNGASVGQWTYYGPRGGSDQVRVHVYTATGPGDPRVTEGTNSIAITFTADGFGNDLGVILSDAATAAIENAALSNQVARYILRYDLIFEHADQYIFFNQHSFVGNDWNYVNIGGAVLSTNAGVVYGVASFSEPLDLPTLGLPASGPFGAPSSVTASSGASWVVADQFATTQAPFTNCTVYIDNIRLVDTYASGATAVVYPLQSFENGGSPLGGATNLFPTVSSFGGNPTSSRAVLSQYATNGLYNPLTDGVPGIFATNSGPTDGDFAVTDGTHALQVTNHDPGYQFQFDFALPLAGTKLAQVLAQNLTPAQLAHYTLRWDSTLPAVTADGDYINIVLNTGSTYFPMAMGRRQFAGQTGLQRITYSVTLDQITAWGNAPTGGDPTIIVAFDAPPEANPFVYYFDNFQLVDTAPAPPTITSSAYNPATHNFTLTWTSVPGGVYSVENSASLAPASFSTLSSGIPSGGLQTTTTVVMPSGASGFLRVKKQ
jgi:hypothetical protein